MINMRPTTVEGMLATLYELDSATPGPYLQSAMMKDICERILALEQQVADLQELASRANKSSGGRQVSREEGTGLPAKLVWDMP